MSRIVYIECYPSGRPKKGEEGFGYFCETLTVVDSGENWIAYVPAADYDQLKRERDEARAKVIELATDLARLRTATAPLVSAFLFKAESDNK